MKTHTLLAAVAASILVATSAQPVSAQKSDAPPQTLFTNVHVFDGVNEARIENASVLIEGNMIKTVSVEAIEAPNAEVIDGGGRTLMPGLMEMHAHLMLMGPTIPAMEADKTWEDFAIHGAGMAEMYLMQGFTTVRDAGGANGGLRRAIDAGQIRGPRYYPSGAFIGTRGGHADFANFTAPPGASTNFSRLNMAVEADSVAPEIRTQQFPYGRDTAQIHAVWRRCVGLRSLAIACRIEGRNRSRSASRK